MSNDDHGRGRRSAMQHRPRPPVRRKQHLSLCIRKPLFSLENRMVSFCRNRKSKRSRRGRCNRSPASAARSGLEGLRGSGCLCFVLACRYLGFCCGNVRGASSTGASHIPMAGALRGVPAVGVAEDSGFIAVWRQGEASPYSLLCTVLASWEYVRDSRI
jgi:hypothetical protein